MTFHTEPVVALCPISEPRVHSLPLISQLGLPQNPDALARLQNAELHGLQTVGDKIVGHQRKAAQPFTLGIWVVQDLQKRSLALLAS